MTATIRLFVPLMALILSICFAPSAALAQSRPVSVADQRQTTKVIRTISRTSDTATVGLTRLQANVDTLLRRLKEKGASDNRLEEVAFFYQRSATASRILAEARINRDADRQIILLRSRSNPGDVLADLESAKAIALAQVRAAESETVTVIQASLDSLVPPAPAP